MPGVREHQVTEEESGRRLDAVLAAQWPDLSRARIQRLMQQGEITAGGRALKPSDTADAGTTILVQIPDPEPSPITPEEIPIDVVYEDEELLVVNKPAGLVVHPGAGNRSGTLVNALLHRLPALTSVGGVERPGLVHRLDKGTSGLLLVAKTDLSHQRLTRALAEREIHRMYVALVWGAPSPEEGRIDLPVGRHPRDRKRFAVVEGGRSALTSYRILEDFGWAARLHCELETGRTHQIRVHLSHTGHPVICDETYGGGARRALNLQHHARKLAREATGVLARPALHAVRLHFSHPVTGRAVTLEAPVPTDMSAALDIMRRGNQAASTDPPTQ